MLLGIQEAAHTEATLDLKGTVLKSFPLAYPDRVNDLLRRIHEVDLLPYFLLHKLLQFLAVGCVDLLPILVDLLFCQVIDMIDLRDTLPGENI